MIKSKGENFLTFCYFYTKNIFDMERNEIIDILNGMCERCLMKGMLPTLDEAKLYVMFLTDFAITVTQMMKNIRKILCICMI